MKKFIIICILILITVITAIGIYNFKKNNAPNRDEINIAFTIDNNYALYTGLTLNSVFKNSKSKFNIYVIENGLSNFNKFWLKTYVNYYGSDIKFIYKKTDEFDIMYGENSKVIPYITSIAVARIFIPELLPEDVSKIIYLDADILVLGDLKELYYTDLKGKPLGMVKQKGKPYYNDGVLLMDLDVWRKRDITGELLEFYREYVTLHPDDFKLPDQDLLNYVLKNDIRKLPGKWNTFGWGMDFYKSKNYKNEKRIFISVYRILHYYGGKKPWVFINNRYMGSRLYQEYWNRSIFVIVKPIYLFKYFKISLIQAYKDILRY